MPNKLKLKKKKKNCEDASCLIGDQPRNTERSPEPLSVPAAGFSDTKHVKLAPVFLRAARHGDRKLQRPGLRPQQQPAERRGGRSPASALHGSLEEIQTTSSPEFPVRAVFNTLQEKSSLQEGASSENSLNRSSHLQKEKRKRGNESSESVSKRPRSEGAVGAGQSHISAQAVEESIDLTAERRNKLSRTRRLRQQSESEKLKTSGSLQTDSSFEDVLWTDKYSPQHSREVVGNSASVNKLQSWLKKWKDRADSDDQRQMEERKREENSSGFSMCGILGWKCNDDDDDDDVLHADSWDCGDFQGEAGPRDDREEPLCNTVLLMGPPGVGKTAAVYACSQELGFKLKEATQSHLVELPGRDPLRPAYFNNYNAKSSAAKSETLPGQTVTATSKKRAAQNFGRKGKARPATVTLANYFKTKAKADQFHFGAPSPSEKPDGKTWSRTPQSRKTTSLILFEEVDVIFDEDVGFLAAIKTFMTTTKRPVVLTTNDPSFRERFSCSLEEIIFKPPSAVDVCTYLQLVALAENVRLDLDDVRGLVGLSGGDVRRCLLQLQLWVHSGGGGQPQELGCVQNSSVTDRGERADLQLPGCTAGMLGLHSATQDQLKKLLKCQFWSETDMMDLLRLLVESWRRGVPLLYSNLELLLPKGTSVHHLDKGTCSEPGPKVSVDDSKPVRKVSRLSRRRRITASDTSTSSSRDETERNAAKVSSDCLDALTDFFDLMSYLDATMPPAEPLVSGSCRPEAFAWTGAEIKDGLLDEVSEEEEEGSSQERLLDIQAAVEGLGCHRCLWRVSTAWTDAQKYRQDLGDASWGRLVERLTFSKTQSLSFSLQPLCAPSVSHRRFELSRAVLSSDSFSLLGNRRAVAVDYMPVLRHVCRFQRRQRQKDEPASRSLNYLSSFSKSTLRLLAEDF
ncbi:ATPase family AAA domain-containing protein 5 [Collichthys lucidus]|uniref:ATPase family AAA domain-containing protein 5 n=1 Tax=Collichthys lucidus TaxID=240159 RepID=A0A4U5U1R7_COLLU|nr:ATPase family AAA domain-containing protein 5 [Collichthys lucidus]